LKNGNVVEILTSKSATPNPGWLNFVTTARARAAIRHYLKTLQHNEAISLGKRLLIRELQAFSLKYADIDKEQLQKLLEEYKLDSEKDLLGEIGLGNRMAPLIARKLITTEGQERKSSPGGTAPLAIKGTEGMVISFPKCCYPLPGDPILGFVTSGRGIVVHNQSCKNVAEFQHQQDKWIEVEWSDNIQGEFPCGLAMDVTNQRGMLATIASAISSVGANILNVDIKDRDDRYTRLTFIIEVRDRRHLADVMRRIRGIRHVSHITRK
jgi:(p)ppGpp synthase/HD superfamily hydrolase